MLLVNFSHPLTDVQREHLESMTRQSFDQIIDVPVQFDEKTPFPKQAEDLVVGVPLTSAEWQTSPLLVVLPSLNFIAALLLAELHGRMGFFPAIVRLRPVEDSLPRQYEVAEILNLQDVREKARGRR